MLARGRVGVAVTLAALLSESASAYRVTQEVKTHTMEVAEVNQSRFAGDYEALKALWGAEVNFDTFRLSSSKTFGDTPESVFWKGKLADGAKVAVQQARPGSQITSWLPTWSKAQESSKYLWTPSEIKQDATYVYALYPRPSGLVEGIGPFKKSYFTLKEIVAKDKDLSLDQVRTIMAKLALAIRGLHRSGVMHTDVSLQNVLVTDDDLTPMLVDTRFQAAEIEFGSSQKCGITRDYGAGHSAGSAGVGTRGYRSPDLGKLSLKDPERFLPCTLDWWAWGVTSLSLLAKQLPDGGGETDTQTNFDTVVSTLDHRKRDIVETRLIGLSRALERSERWRLPQELMDFLHDFVLLPEDQEKEWINYSYQDFSSGFWSAPFWQGINWNEL